MPVGRNLFTNITITGTAAAPSAPVPVGAVDWLGVGLTVSSVAGVGATATFVVEWSFDNAVWTDGTDAEDQIITTAVTGTHVRRMPVKAPYWRLAAINVVGTYVVTGNALIW